MVTLRACFLFPALLLLTACTTVNVFEYQKDSRADDVYLKQGVDFSRYQAVQIRAISVWYPNATAQADENARDNNIAKAQNLFKQVISDELGENYQVVDQPGRDALWLHVEFIDLRSLNPGDPIPAAVSQKEFNTRAGHITLVAELRDSVSEEVLARAADLGRKSQGGPGIVEWDEIEADFRKWAVMLREWMDEIHNN